MEKCDYVLNPRRITDWIVRGFLPPRQSRGRGKARGRVYYWEDVAVIDQARTVFKLLTVKHRFKAISLPLLALGYPIPAPMLRTAIREWLDSLGGELDPDAVDGPEEMALWIGDIVRTQFRKFRRLDHEQEIVARNLFLNPGYVLSSNELALLETPSRVDEPVNWIESARAHLSYPAMDRALDTCQDGDLLMAAHDWITLYWLFKPRVLESMDDAPGAVDWNVWLTLASRVFLPLVLFADISIRREGYGGEIDRFVSKLSGSERLAA